MSGNKGAHSAHLNKVASYGDERQFGARAHFFAKRRHVIKVSGVSAAVPNILRNRKYYVLYTPVWTIPHGPGFMPTNRIFFLVQQYLET